MAMGNVSLPALPKESCTVHAIRSGMSLISKTYYSMLAGSAGACNAPGLLTGAAFLQMQPLATMFKEIKARVGILSAESLLMPALKAVNIGQQFALRQPTHHLLIDGLGDWVPGLVVLHMAMVGVVCPMADPPAVVGHQDGAVHDVPHQVIDLAAVAEALVPAAHHAQKSGCAPA